MCFSFVALGYYHLRKEMKGDVMQLKRLAIVILGLSLIFSFGCASTVDERGKSFSYQNEIKIIPGHSTKRQLLDVYGQPTSSTIIGKYQVLRYYYARKSMKHGRAIGQGLLSAATFGISELAADHGVKDSDMQVEYKEILAYVDLQSGIIKDYYYHDSDLNGHDESESLLLKADSLEGEGGKSGEVMELLEKSISLNGKNHRALNNLAWKLIDGDINIDKGIMLAKKAVEVFPDSPYNNGTLGVGYFKKGDFDNAEKYLQTAVNLRPIYAPEDTEGLQYDKSILQVVRNQKK